MNPKKALLSFANANPQKKICFLHSGLGGKSILAIESIETYSGDCISEFREFQKRNSKNLLIGYFAYDLGYELHNIKRTAEDDLELPNIHFKAYKKWEEFDTTQEEQEGTEGIKFTDASTNGDSRFKSNITKKEYDLAYKKIKNYIKEGDIYQVNLTHRLEAQTQKSAQEIFLAAVDQNPVNYLAYIEGDGFEVISASPECFVKIEGENIETLPIKGTRPRGNTAQEDESLKNELIENEKEAAELNMITDLLRNDIGKVSKKGSVKVEEHRVIKKCSNVWHTYSRVTGELRTSRIDTLISMLPGGSITGCPKKRAMEIIDELEPNTRGVYTGVIGYIHPNDKLEFNIAIRTIIKKKENVYLQVGGGIVQDSKEEAEYEETLQKAKSLINTI
jgi:para-aminobenzoate synthetase component 1